MAEDRSGSCADAADAADEHDLDEARNHLISALSVHATSPNGDSASSTGVRDGSLGTKVSSNADVGSSAASETLTDSEVSFLSSLLNDPKVPPKYVTRASKRLSDVTLFPPPSKGESAVDGDVDGNGEGQKPLSASPRNHSLQEELFRKHERSGMRPSLVLKKLSHNASITPSAKSQRIRRRSHGVTAGKSDVRLASKNRDQTTSIPYIENPVGSNGAKGKNKRADVVRNASHLSQGFEVMCPPAHSGASLGSNKVDNASAKPGIKVTKQIQFQAAEDEKLLLAGLDKLGNVTPQNDDAATNGDIHSDAAIEEGGQHVHDDVSSWDLSAELHSDDDVYCHQPDAWDVLKDEYSLGYGYDTQDTQSDLESLSTSFKILGTSGGDIACHPHVLSPPLMESLLSFMPETVADCNFYLKYSMVRDGPTLYQLLRNVRSSARTVLAVETDAGFVFGSFTSAAWRSQQAFFGSHESFVWRMRRSRLTACHSIVEQAIMESELEVFPYAGKNNNVQLCHSNIIGLGGKKTSTDQVVGASKGDEEDRDYGFALSFSSDLTHGQTSASETFNNPCLVKLETKGTSFRVANIEVWSMTPFATTAEAEKDELARLFFFEEKEAAGEKLNFFKILMGSPMRD